MPKLLDQGNIVYFKYKRYHKDPYPLALILYADDKIVHCLNLHYLSDKLSDKVLEMIVFIVFRKIEGKNPFKLYHNYLKPNLPEVVLKSYRTYKPEYINNVIFVSRGFNETKNIMYKLINKKKSEEKVKNIIKKEISLVQNSTPDELINNEKFLPPDKILSNVDNYFSKLKDIIKPSIDPQKYTGIKKKRG